MEKAHRATRAGVVAASLAVILLVTQACGYILYPERRGQKSGEMDPITLVLDGALALCFLVPGVIAFAVDITTGAIYMPRGGRKASLEGDAPTVVDFRHPRMITREMSTAHAIDFLASTPVTTEFDARDPMLISER